MTYQEPTPRHDGDDPEGLPFCGASCPACAAEEAAAQAAHDALLAELDSGMSPEEADAYDRWERALEAQSERAASEGSQGFYWGGGEREDAFYHQPAF
jgi:hypothetical protein